MHNTSSSKLLLIALSFLFSQANAAQKNEISGTIYVVTNARSVIRMPLVDVFLYSKSQHSTARAKAQKSKMLYLEEKKQELSDLNEKKNAIEPDVTRALDEVRDIRSRAESVSRQCIINGGNYSTCNKHVDQTEMLNANRIMDKYSAIIDELSQTNKKISEINNKANFFTSPEGVIDLISQETPVSESKTNINGEFKLRTNSRGEFVILAKSQRKTISDKEQYTWAVFANTGDNIELTNDNLIETLCKKCAR